MKIVIDGMHSIPLDGTWGMVANFIWMSVILACHDWSLAYMRRLAEMWLGIICACLPAVHSFFVRTFIKKTDHDNRDLHAVRDPNSGRVIVSDSGYHSAELSAMDLETIGSEDHEYSPSTIRAMASDKNLLASAKR